MARRLDVDAVRYQGNWFPHALRPAAEDGVFFAGDSAGHCLPLSGEGIRTAFHFGIACGRELRAVHAGRKRRERGARLLRRVQRLPRHAFRMMGRLQRWVPALPPRALTALIALAGRRRPCTWAFDRYLGIAPPPAGSPRPRIPRPMEAIAYDERGLVPCVIQDARTGEVLTLAYMNAEALAKTRETGELHLWSRSRDELWHKGATSGNTQAVRALRYDCDADAVLALVDPAGPACHTGARTCFHNGDATLTEQEALPALERTIAERAAGGDTAGSYTAQLLADPRVRGGEGAGGGRGGRPRRPRGDRRARRRGGRRRPLPPDRAAAHARAGAGRRREGPA